MEDEGKLVWSWTLHLSGGSVHGQGDPVRSSLLGSQVGLTG